MEAVMVQVCFATNRQRLPDTAAGLPDFSDQCAAANPAGFFCATATVEGVDLVNPSNGKITAVTEGNTGSFADEDLQPILASPNDILVFVHGAGNSFNDAIARAAYNQNWLAKAVLPSGSANFDIIAFTWPARSYSVANLIGDFLDYRHDQGQATNSAFHFGLLLRSLYVLRQRTGRRRLNLLCHSMGNYALGGAVEPWFANLEVPEVPVFDEAILAAADETATTFGTPSRRLSKLSRLAHEITVYNNRDDILMELSHVANQDRRLGDDGPPNKPDTHLFSPNVYEFVDCTGVNDFVLTLLEAPDRSHQYYRSSPTVRADIAASLAGLTPVRKAYNPQTNVYRLF
jgi:esterase/lipase superfamily enzyme